MTRFFGYVFVGVAIIGFGANALLFVYAEWLALSKGPAMFLHPLFHIAMVLGLLSTRAFWLFLVLTVVGLVGAVACERHGASPPRPTKPVRW